MQRETQEEQREATLTLQQHTLQESYPVPAEQELTQKGTQWTKEMALQLRAQTPLAEDLSSIPAPTLGD